MRKSEIKTLVITTAVTGVVAAAVGFMVERWLSKKFDRGEEAKSPTEPEPQTMEGMRVLPYVAKETAFQQVEQQEF